MNLRRLLLLCCCIFYYFVLQYSYHHVEGVMYAEIGLVVRPPSAIYGFLAFCLAMVPVSVLPLSVAKPSDVAIYMLYLTVVTPFTFIPYHVLNANPLHVLGFSIFLSLLFCGLIVYCRGGDWKLPALRLETQTVIQLLCVLNFLLILVVSGTAGFHYDLSLALHYDRRMMAREVVSGGSLQAYSIATLSGAVAPLLVSVGYLWKKPLALFSGVMGLLTIFAFSGTKTDLFSPVFLAGVYCLMLLPNRQRPMWVVGAAIGLLVASLSQFFLFDRFDLSVYFCRRTLFVPALLTSYYWDFFSENPHIFYADSFLRWTLTSPYDLQMARTIGLTYFGSHEANANANIWASSFGHLGYLGMLGTTLMLGVILRIIDSVSATGDARLGCMLTAQFALVWSHGALETSILTNGVGVSIILLWAISSKHSASLQNVPSRRFSVFSRGSHGNLATQLVRG